jgi:hypothetical protein
MKESWTLNNQELRQTNSAIRNDNTRNKDQLHRDQLPKLGAFKKVQTMLTSKPSSLPSNLKKSYEEAQFKVVSKRYLNTHAFYSLYEVVTFKNDQCPYSLHHMYTLY